MATYLADRVIVFEGSPSVEATAGSPQNLLVGMNRFLQLLGITFRRDPNNFRPRINKSNSVKVSTFHISRYIIFFTRYRFNSYFFTLVLNLFLYAFENNFSL